MAKQINIKSEVIKEYMKKNHLSEEAFCKKCKICESTLKKMLNPNTEVSKLRVLTIIKVANAIGVKFSDLAS